MTTRQDLVAVLRLLPRRQRETVVLRFLEDFDVATVARLLHCTEGTVKRATSDGLANLRRHYAIDQRGGS